MIIGAVDHSPFFAAPIVLPLGEAEVERMSGFHIMSWLFVATVVLTTVSKGIAVCYSVISYIIQSSYHAQ